MLVLEVLMGLKYKQGYVTSEFIHVDVDKGLQSAHEIGRAS